MTMNHPKDIDVVLSRCISEITFIERHIAYPISSNAVLIGCVHVVLVAQQWPVAMIDGQICISKVG